MERIACVGRVVKVDKTGRVFRLPVRQGFRG